VIGPLFEDNLRKALLIHRGDWGVFFGSNTTLVIWAITFLAITLWLALYFYSSKNRGQAK
jgi:TctA family transporter